MAFPDYLSREAAKVREAAARGWKQAELVASKAPDHRPVDLRRVFVKRGLQMWAQKAAAKRLRNVVSKTLPKRIDMIVEEFNQPLGERDFSASRKRWLRFAEEESKAEKVDQVTAVAGARLRRQESVQLSPVGGIAEEWKATIREDQKSLKEWKALGLLEGLEVLDEVLLYKGKPLVDKESRFLLQLFDAAHCSPLAGHRSVPATVWRMRDSVHCAGLAEWVTERINSCELCKKAKHGTQRNPLARVVKTVPELFETVHIDAALGLPLSNGFDKIWIVVDRFSHWVTLIPARTGDTAEETARRLFDGHWAWFGLPSNVITDQDPLFTSGFSKALDQLLQVEHHFTPARRHEGNGMVERQVRTLKE